MRIIQVTDQPCVHQRSALHEATATVQSTIDSYHPTISAMIERYRNKQLATEDLAQFAETIEDYANELQTISDQLCYSMRRPAPKEWRNP